MAVVVGITLVGVAFVDVPLLFAVIPLALGFTDDADMAVLDGLSEEIVGVNFDGGVLVGQIEGAIGLGGDGERGQVVAADFDGGVGGGVFITALAEGGLNAIVAEAEVIGDLPIGGGDAEGGGFELSAKDESVVGVEEFQGDGFGGDSFCWCRRPSSACGALDRVDRWACRC